MIISAMQSPASAAASPQPLSGALRLDDWGVIRATGADARSFLHGQLTQDVQGLGEAARLAGYCTAKGRLLASFVIWRDGPEAVCLATSADVLPTVLKRLKMFVLRARCVLEDASAAMPVWGLAGEAASPAPAWSVLPRAEGGLCIALPPALAHGRLVPRALQIGGEAPEGLTIEPLVWRGLEAASGVARIVAATAEQFVPQMVNLELVGGVNFQKGCYPGQEIVARSQYRGTLKRRAALLRSPTLAEPGQELFHSEDPGQPAGQVALAGTLPGLGTVMLAELKLAALESGSLHLGAPDGPLLSPDELPYPLPADQG